MKQALARTVRRSRLLATALAYTLLVAACKPQSGADDPSDVAGLRDAAEDSSNPKLVAQWLLAELLQPGGDAKRAEQARKTLDKLKATGLLPELARGIDDRFHGRLAHASRHFLKAAQAARLSPDADSDLLAHYAIREAIAFRNNTQDLWSQWQAWTTSAIEEPKHLGFEARDELVDWWMAEAWANAADDIDDLTVAKLGCFENIRIAGPFGSGAASEVLRHHAPEQAQPWPEQFEPDSEWGRTPRVLEAEQSGCSIAVDEPTGGGVFYAETFFEVKELTQAILRVNGAHKVWVDGVLVFDRDLSEWGSWTKVASGLTIPKGCHRIVARLVAGETSIRLMQPNGLPLNVPSSIDSSRLYGVEPARATSDPSPLRRYVHPRGVRGPQAVWLRYIAAELALAEGEAEVSAMLVEPLVKDVKRSTGPALSAAAAYVQNDPLFDQSQTEDMMREFHKRALERDPELWISELNAVQQLAKGRGIIEALPAFKRLTERYREVPALLGALASVYGELGWTPEYKATVKLRAERFPEDPEGLYAAAQVLTEEGKREESDALHERIRELDPDSEVFVSLALERRDYDVAIKELERLKARRPTRKDIQHRIDQIEVYAGKSRDVMNVLRREIEENPSDAQARLALADALYAGGDSTALRNAIADAVQAGSDPAALKDALDLVEGLTELEPYRLDAKDIIAEYEQSGRHLPGTAARVLDYMVAWVRADGSSRLLEHEIIRIQSEEAIGRFAEHAVRGDVVLQMRVIKKDGQILEPEPVAGKPTVTFPHLEIGDYIETEQIYAHGGSPGGAYYDGPHWFFREQGIAYARSELVLISPAHQAVDIETTGPVPEPITETRGYFKVYRWRVDSTPPAPTEPLSVPVTEYLPSVRISWGLDLERRLRLMTTQVVATTPVDPRIVRIARGIVKPIPASKKLDRAKQLYRWVLKNVQEGEEDDGRRVVTGKRGNPWRAFETLCRALDIDVDWAIAKNRLAPPPKGPDMEARQFNTTVLRVGDTDPVWLTFDGRFVPFGYVPAAVRAMPAYVLAPDGPKLVTLPEAGTQDGIKIDLDIKLSPNGSAELRVTQHYEGAFASSLRQGLDEVPERRLHDVIEEQLLVEAFPGARLLSYDIQELNDLDVPLVIVMEAEMAHFARREQNTLRVRPPYTPGLSRLASLPTRQTAILLGAERRREVTLNIDLPTNAKAKLSPQASLSFQDFKVEVSDAQAGSRLKLGRKVIVPATRIAPESYTKFMRFTQEADAALNREIVIEL